ncbi:sulfotransferase [Leptothoe sp. LEGE 181152]|nr:sulfotransferase [Leptothoe sp. LEGE 181152]
MTPQNINFLGIGAQKAGTTWLWSVLKTHPDIWMPPKKELHYFDRDPGYPSPSHLASKHFFQRLIGKEDCNKEFRKHFRFYLLQLIKLKTWDIAAWNHHYYTGTYSDDWYLSLFKDGQNSVKGEITPSYSILSQNDIQRIKQLFPDLKVILILRNPIDRAWSQLRFDYMKNRIDNIQSLEKIKAKIEHPSQCLRSDYLRIIENWSAYFEYDQLFIGFFDDVIKKPRKLILEISSFLELDISKFAYSDALVSPKNTSIKKDIPDEIEYYLAQKYYASIKSLAKSFDNPASDWLERVEEILRTAPSDLK